MVYPEHPLCRDRERDRVRPRPCLHRLHGRARSRHENEVDRVGMGPIQGALAEFAESFLQLSEATRFRHRERLAIYVKVPP